MVLYSVREFLSPDCAAQGDRGSFMLELELKSSREVFEPGLCHQHPLQGST